MPDVQSVAKANGARFEPTVAANLKDCYREAAAWNLYEMVRPVGGLRWLEMSDGQKNEYRHLIDAAAAATAKGAES